MSDTPSDDFVALARLAIGDGFDAGKREPWVRPLAQLLEAASRGVGQLPVSECPIPPGAPTEFFAIAGEKVLLRRNAEYWSEVRQRLARLQARGSEPLSSPAVDQALEAVLPRSREHSESGRLTFDNGDQRDAVRALIDVPLGVLTGGPGTGKTTCIAAMLAVRKRIQPDLDSEHVLLCAPTGKAACRLGESIEAASARLPLDHAEREFLCSMTPQTLHRALRWGPKPPERNGPFGHGPERPLNQRLVIVDEASMVDLYLMAHLLRALRPDASLLLLGDADQLESVEAGGVLVEVVNAAGAGGTDRFRPVVARLCHSYRAKQSPWIIELSALARPGVRCTVQQFVDCCEAHAPNLRLHGNRRSLLSVCREQWARSKQEARAWNLLRLPTPAEVGQWLRRFQLLCADNAQVERANRRGVGELWGEHVRPDRYGVPHGCPVLVLQNRHALGLANGDVGVAIGSTSSDLAQVVVFPGLDEPVPIAQLPPFQPAFAITIHKSQGSEWERVAIDLPNESELLDRNLLYTAISRSSGTLDIYVDCEQTLATVLNQDLAGVAVERVSRIRRPAAESSLPIGTQLSLFDLVRPGNELVR